MKSIIHMNEKVINKNRKSRNEAAVFYPCVVVNDITEEENKAAFTSHELQKAMRRGRKNPEDVDILDVERPYNKTYVYYIGTLAFAVGLFIGSFFL